MSEEYLYHITPKDLVLGRITRRAAHRDPSLIHREIAVLLGDNNGDLLLAKRSKGKRFLPGKWDLTCAGHVPWGMSSEEAAHAELEEELGFDTSLEYVGRQLTYYDWETHLSHLFVGSYRGEEIVLQDEEVAAARMFDGDGIRSLGNNLSREFREFIFFLLEDEQGTEVWDREYDLRGFRDLIAQTNTIRRI